MIINSFLNSAKDKRENRGKRYNLSSVLSLVIGGLLRGCNNIASIHRWGKALSKKELLQLVFYDGKICCYSSLTLILQKVDSNDILKVMCQMHKLLGDLDKPIYHIDGKFLKNSNCYGAKKYSQILTMFNNKTGATVNHQEIEGRDERKAMHNLLEKSNVQDAIITSDAAFTH